MKGLSIGEVALLVEVHDLDLLSLFHDIPLTLSRMVWGGRVPAATLGTGALRYAPCLQSGCALLQLGLGFVVAGGLATKLALMGS